MRAITATTAKIFISYARADDPDFVRRLHRDLLARARADRNCTLKLFYDKRDMPSRGRSFLLEIRDFIGDPDSERILLVVGPRALESPYVQAEWRAALDRCVTVVPLLRIGKEKHDRPRDPRSVDDADYGSIPAEVQETRVHAIDFRARRGALPGRPYREAFEELWRVLADPVAIGDLGPEIPDLPGNFIPRTEYIRLLTRYLLPDADAPVTVHAERRFAVLSGMGGVGKSVIAASFCRACKTRRSFKNGIAWMRMGPRPQLPAQLANIFGGQQHLSRARRGRLALADLACLIVLDDVTDPADVAPFANAIGPSGRLLITTRDATVATALNAQRCDVDVLTEKQSAELLADWIGCAPSSLPGPAVAAVHECGGLPLAIAMIGAMMKGKPQDRWNYVLADLSNANLEEIRHRFPNYEHPDMLRAVQVSVDGLEGFAGDRRDATWARKVHAKQRYLELAVFAARAAIPLSSLHAYWAPTGVSESIAAKLCDLYVDRSLARRDGLGRIALHDLQRDYLVGEQRDRLKSLHIRLLDALRPRGGWCQAPDDGYLLEHLAGHLRAAGRIEELNGLVIRSWMARRYAATGSHHGFASDVEAALEAATEEGRGEDLVSVTRACLVLGTIGELAAAVPPEFIGAMARTGQVDKSLHNASLIADHASRVYALSEVGTVLVDEGGRETALAVVEQILNEVKDTSDRALEIAAVAWASRCLAQLGRTDQAIATAQRALTLTGKGAKRDPYGDLYALANVARAYWHAGRLADARRIARQVLKASRHQGHKDDAIVLLLEVGERRDLVRALKELRGEEALHVAERLFEVGEKAESTKLARSVLSDIAGSAGHSPPSGGHVEIR